MNNKLSFIIVNYNNAGLTADCVFSIERHLNTKYNLEIFIVDNGSEREDIDNLKSHSFSSAVNILFSKVNLGFGSGNNLANSKITGRYVIYLNNDTLLINDSIKYGIELLEQNTDVGMVGAKLLNTDLSPDLSYGYFPFLDLCIIEFFRKIPLKYFKRSGAVVPPNGVNAPFEIDFPCGAFMLLRYEDFKKLNGFDKDYFMYFEETDMAYRLRKLMQKKIVCHPKIEIIHKAGSTVEKNRDANREHFYKSWKIFLLKHRNIFIVKLIKIVLMLTAFKKMLINYARLQFKDLDFLKKEIKYIYKYM